MQLPRDMQHSWNKMYKKYSADTVIYVFAKRHVEQYYLILSYHIHPIQT
jgi:hypothetical protein